MDHTQLVTEKIKLHRTSNLEKNFKSTFLRQAEAKGNARNIFASADLLLRVALSIFILAFLLKNKFLKEG
jgi:hypothetical protein